MQITRSSLDTQKGPDAWFTGDVYIDPVAAAPAPSRIIANLVHFMPGARTAWHRHPLGQNHLVSLTWIDPTGCPRRFGGAE